MANQLDYYRILQVHPRAEKEVIDAAYRGLASKYHPDVSRIPDAEERMKQINIAYEALSDPARRAAYDAARGMTYASDTTHCAATRAQYLTKAWRILLIAAGIMLFAVVVLRLGPALPLLVLKLMLPLAAISLVIWLLFSLVKPRG